jgi:hypothetical protein
LTLLSPISLAPWILTSSSNLASTILKAFTFSVCVPWAWRHCNLMYLNN